MGRETLESTHTHTAYYSEKLTVTSGAPLLGRSKKGLA